MSSAPVANDPAARQYFVDTESDIIAILQILANENVPLMLSAEGNPQRASTRILTVDSESRYVVLDTVPDPALARSLCNTDEIEVHAYQQQVEIQFELKRATTILFQDKPALRADLPRSLIGTNRRASFRAKTDDSAPAPLLISVAHQPATLPCRIADISTGGCAFETDGNALRYDPGTLLSDCALDLPGIGTLKISVEVRHSSDFRDASGHAKRRFGCRFVELPGNGGAMIQKYIQQIDPNQ
jgi:c-di-GMP-binding flagellar brake protein YcgR